MTTSLLVFDDKDRIGDWVAERVGQLSPWGSFYAMGAELKGEIVSGLVLNNFTDSSATVHLAVSIPTKTLSELLNHAFCYAFEDCKLRRLTGLVEENNAKSLKIIRHIGFVDEGVMQQAGTGGQDIIVLVLWPENYRKGKLNG
jgi:L-amino acid N-acyltransferase YncA|tara:strand:+ start:2755 stop:3183 length:429 start_codon:yes stop_codon:yes gene_type:complete